jgi:signal transduction histidine kinase
VLAVGPLATIGILDYFRSERLVQRLVVAQTDTVAHRAAKAITERYGIVSSDILLLTENAEIQRLLAELSRGDSSAIRTARAAADEYLSSVWHIAENTYSSAELRDTAGRTLWRASNDSARGFVDQGQLVITEPLRDLRSGRVVGSVALTPRPEALWPRDALGPSFGRTGYGAIIDRRTNRVLAHPATAVLFKSPRELFGKDWTIDSARFAEPSGWLEYRERDSLRTASFVSLTSPPWTILSSTATGEFADEFLRARRSDIALLVLLIGAVAVAFAFFITRATRSLEELTRAAAAVGRGNLFPSLPPVGSDEVGTLSGAFGEMTSRIGSMMREVEVSRQLAVLGEFAAQLSHEVRNPLTSLKLDLQGLQRQVRAGELPPHVGPSVDSSLREVNRLDSVVGGVLELAHRPTPKRVSFCLGEVVDQTLTTLSTQLSSRGVRVERRIDPSMPRLFGDPELLGGMVMNLLINASDVQPNGGRVGVLTAPRNDPTGMMWIDLTIADDGPGIPRAKREEVFRPFYTTRADGTGLGLALALRTARDHGGHIVCGEAIDGFKGAAFVVSLPAPSA